MIKINILNLLDKLEDLVEGSFRIPLIGKFLVDEENFFVISNKIRASLPDEIKQATRISKEVEQIKEAAKIESEKIINTAKEQAENLLKESELRKQAEKEAESIIEESKKFAEEIKRGSDDYANKILSSLEASLNKILQEVKKGQEILNKRIEGEK